MTSRTRRTRRTTRTPRRGRSSPDPRRTLWHTTTPSPLRVAKARRCDKVRRALLKAHKRERIRKALKSLKSLKDKRTKEDRLRQHELRGQRQRLLDRRYKKECVHFDHFTRDDVTEFYCGCPQSSRAALAKIPKDELTRLALPCRQPQTPCEWEEVQGYADELQRRRISERENNASRRLGPLFDAEMDI